MTPAKCPFLHRCSKYAELTRRIDRKDEVIAAKDREIARLRAENAALNVRLRRALGVRLRLGVRALGSVRRTLTPNDPSEASP